MVRPASLEGGQSKQAQSASLQGRVSTVRMGARQTAGVGLCERRQGHPQRGSAGVSSLVSQPDAYSETRKTRMMKGSRRVRGFAAKGVRQYDGFCRGQTPGRDPEGHLSKVSCLNGMRRVVFWSPKGIGATGQHVVDGLPRGTAWLLLLKNRKPVPTVSEKRLTPGPKGNQGVQKPEADGC